MHPIEVLCKERNISRYKLAKDSGVAETTLNMMINRNTRFGRMPVENFFNISNSLGLDMNELYAYLKKIEEN